MVDESSTKIYSTIKRRKYMTSLFKASAIPSHMKHSELIRNKSAPIESPSIPPPSLFTPSHAIWGRSELSVGPISSPQS